MAKFRKYHLATSPLRPRVLARRAVGRPGAPETADLLADGERTRVSFAILLVPGEQF